MSLQSDTPASHVALAPPVTHLTDESVKQDTTAIRDSIVDAFSEGSHHASEELPTTGTTLPAREPFRKVLGTVQTYLSTTGCSLIADAHLQGLGAVVNTTDAGTVYAYLDEDVFESIIHHVIEETGVISDAEARDDVVQALVLAHTMEFETSMQEADIDAVEAASWPEFTGKETSNPVGVVFSTPHPVPTLDASQVLPERGLGLTAGIQQLTVDIDSVYGQTDIAVVYLTAYLTGHGLTRDQAYDTVSAWYDVPRECVLSLTRDVADELGDDGLPTERAEQAYYLTEDALDELRPEN